MAEMTCSRRLVAETLGTGFLVAIVVGSGIMAKDLAGGDIGAALLYNTIATGAGLAALIAMFIRVSGAHFNPVVSLAAAIHGDLPWREFPPYSVAQIVGGIGGVAIANVMFSEPVFSLATTERSGAALAVAEIVATFGLVAVIFGTAKSRLDAVPYAVGAYIAAGYWFTSSTSFANPAVTIARVFSDTFAGIRAADAPVFIAAQIAGSTLAAYLFLWLFQPPAGNPSGDPNQTELE